MILQAKIARQIGDNIFIVEDSEENQHQIKVNYKTFPEESLRLLGHHCSQVAGIRVGTDLEIDLSEGFVYDIRFNVGDVVPSRDPEVSRVDHVIGDGVMAFFARQCNCQIFGHSAMILATSPVHTFEEGQNVRHRTERFKGKVSACAITVLD
jgi:hypothetical protein